MMEGFGKLSRSANRENLKTKDNQTDNFEASPHNFSKE